MNRQFVENDAGVHLMMGEYTLCGDAADAPESEPDWTEGAFQPTDRQTISCPRCVEIVMACRGLQVKKNANR